MDERIDSLGDAKDVSTVEVNAGHFRIEMDENGKEKTAFVTHFNCSGTRRLAFND